MRIDWPHFPELEIETDLFDDAKGKDTYGESRAIIEDKLVSMLEAGDFYLTQVMNQELHLADYAGDVIFGRGIEDGNQTGGRVDAQINGLPIHPIIEESRVYIEAVDRGCTKHRPEPDKDCPRCQRDRELSIVPVGKAPIRYIDGTAPVNKRLAGRTKRTKSPQVQLQERWVDLEKTEGFLTLKQAWLVLRHTGAYVRLAPHQDDREMFWMYREVHPAELRARKAEGPKGKAASK